MTVALMKASGCPALQQFLRYRLSFRVFEFIRLQNSWCGLCVQCVLLDMGQQETFISQTDCAQVVSQGPCMALGKHCIQMPG
jgi:hypothetical protein